MALYLGDKKFKINLNKVMYDLNLYSNPPITNGIRLLSSENLYLKTNNGLYLTAKEDK